ncbi:MAG: metal ABC transporter permease [Actinobacteria bacterium]|nr:metal ABC transporter permease [Actinomycetota bacterium]MBW3641586.1 metal ABC transporter permease [Actinomycetota bacterium]
MNPFELEFMQRAFVATAVIAAVAPLVGSFIVQRGQSLVGDGMGHVAFAGVGLALLIGTDPVVGALAFTALAGVLLVRMGRAGLAGDLAIALIFYGGIAVGYLFSARAGAGQTRLVGLLFGSPLNLTWPEVGVIVALALAVVVVTVVLYPKLVALALDEQAARVAGVATDRLVMALTLMVALVVVAGMSSIGLLLISAMMVVPVAAAAQVASSYRSTLLLASAIGATSAAAGLLASFYGDYAPASAIVLIAIACYLAATGWRSLVRRISSTAVAGG